jgi:hypothetical protein
VADLTYQFRLGLRRGVETYTLTEDVLTCSSGDIPLREVVAIRVYTVPGSRSFTYGPLTLPTRRCTIWSEKGHKIVLSSVHFVGFGRFEDRAESYVPFVRALVRRVAACAPGARLAAGMPLAMWWSWAIAFGAMVAGIASIVLFGAIGFIVEKQLSWSGFALWLLFATLAIGPISFLRALWPLRTRPLDLNEI